MKKFSLPEYFTNFVPHISLLASNEDFTNIIAEQKLNDELNIIYEDKILKTIYINKIFIKIGSRINVIKLKE